MKVVLVGGGPANLYLALRLLEFGHTVHLYEKTSSPGKKFLVAGKSGLNITHSELIENFAKKYFEHEKFFLSLLQDFSNKDLVNWLNSLGIKTFVGSSGRVFPESFKASEILKIWMDKLKSNSNFKLLTQHQLTAIDLNEVTFNNEVKVSFDKIVYGLGGASWSKTGSDGSWKSLFEKHHIRCVPFAPLNGGFVVYWSDSFKSRFERGPLKNIELILDDRKIKGELMITSYGVEGTPIYSLSRFLREQLNQKQKVKVFIDLKPDLSLDEVKKKLEKKREKDSYANYLRKSLALSKLAIALLKEFSTKEDYQEHLPELIKRCPLELVGTRDIEEAISSSGGVAMDEINEQMMLLKLPHHYAIGEMLDWDTITGGYLLQGCFSQAHRVFRALSEKNKL